MSNEYDKYEHQRELLQMEVTKTVLPPFSFEFFKKTPEEKVALKRAKREYKNQSTGVLWSQN